MHLSSVIPTCFLTLLLTWCLIPSVGANVYFVVTAPLKGGQWSNGAANQISWSKGLLDDVNSFDIEMSRMSVDGLTYIASYVPATSTSLNVFLQDVPPADDYYLLFVNSTVGIKYALSDQFSIRSASNATTTTSDGSAPTVTISGSPNPLSVFATTFPASANGVALPGYQVIQGSMHQIVALTAVMAFSLLGGAMTIL